MVYAMILSSFWNMIFWNISQCSVETPTSRMMDKSLWVSLEWKVKFELAERMSAIYTRHGYTHRYRDIRMDNGYILVETVIHTRTQGYTHGQLLHADAHRTYPIK